MKILNLEKIVPDEEARKELFAEGRELKLLQGGKSCYCCGRPSRRGVN